MAEIEVRILPNWQQMMWPDVWAQAVSSTRRRASRAEGIPRLVDLKISRFPAVQAILTPDRQGRKKWLKVIPN
ncbi:MULTISPECIES: hypothetical protein [unclassified Mesorhizobium]|uniref:hypothetical protein n=1 Tax=unclassified Mesorhizobium TaxID=325217 RepID=UPI000FD87EF9|nr:MULTISPECIES: hypothetical protein [unclassified Mesorhizobium]TGQ45932.1 hypothetical protein EN859_006255 [Mesorhizobium sp. M00.F.Ca.ET.216.01.1.1]TIS56491.1 MAG: hypothetical protein E5W91_18285 [Mesorhizobium sp.]TIS91096.1 MAG: hypothetical protein E5W89_09055 [Mesorhizobium sp.]TJW07465.1 MAG: hypothetical protein E5W82_23635 [Mesorhizobium sp.]TJW42743.1 MAG: hypothetical protein E5W83_19945 [Mesorhizobium sp.]